MQKKYGLVGIGIASVFIIGIVIGSIPLLPNLNEESKITDQAIEQTQLAEAEEQNVQEYTLVIEQTDIQISPNAVWHADAGMIGLFIVEE